jgi:cysteinyl-tRNA synthetase
LASREQNPSDPLFPHHENEIAQSEAANGKEFAHYWMHNGFINIDNKKMSKSEGNFFTVREICEQYDPQVVRFFILNSHYRSPLNFSKELMEAAKNSLNRILTSIGSLKHLLDSGALKREFISSDEQLVVRDGEALNNKFIDAMDDDFNTSDAIAAIFETVKLANTNCNGDSSVEFVKLFHDRLINLCDILGIKTEKEEELLDAEIEKLIEDRQAARKNKDFAKSDQIRDILLEKGIVLEDTREGVRWKRS